MSSPTPAIAQTTPNSKKDDFVARAFGIDQGPVVNGGFANDAFGDGQDRYYTSGLNLRVLLDADTTPFLETPTADAVFGRAPRRLQLQVGQTVFTPEALSEPDPIEDDRPYGAFLYVGADIVTLKPNRSVFGFETLVEDTVGVQLGVVGQDASLGEWVQTEGHKFFDGAGTRGWENGLNDEPGFNLIANRAYHFFGAVGPLDTEIRPSAEVSLGTVQTQATLGAEFRIGDDLHYDLSRADNRTGVPGGGFFGAPDGSSWALFVGAHGRAVAHDVFLDGNVFVDGPPDEIDVERRPFVADLSAGASVVLGSVRFGYTHVWSTETFVEQREMQEYGMLILGVNF